MKYIIDIPEDAEYGILTYRRVDGGFCTKDIDITETEQLTSDYINEHFSDLQDEAYQRGLKDGRNETWEAAKKIALYHDEGGTSILDLTEIFDCFTIQQVFRRYTVSETLEKLKAYKEKKEDKIKLGDGLEHISRECSSKAIFLEEIEYYGENWYRCLFWTGCEFTILCYPKSQFKPTGKHYDIDKILDEMKE